MSHAVDAVRSDVNAESALHQDIGEGEARTSITALLSARARRGFLLFRRRLFLLGRIVDQVFRLYPRSHHHRSRGDEPYQ